MNYQQEHIKPYDQSGSKGEQVERMFDNIAHSYDKLNHLLSFNIDKYWRKAALKSLKPFAPQRILDIATGTGDFALMAAKILRPQEIVGADLSEGMLNVARAKAIQSEYARNLSFCKEDCMALSFPSATFDAITVAYGIRNFENLDRGLKEMLRVLKPSGRLVIIELTTPQKGIMKHLFQFYSRVWMPLVGRLISRDSKAYSYLPATMEAFPQGEVMSEILAKAGFTDIQFKRFTGGISTLYTAARPS